MTPEQASQSGRRLSPQLDEPPADFHIVVKQAKRQGFWCRAARHEYARSRAGGRYAITLPEQYTPVYASDDLDDIRGWLANYAG